MAKQKYYVVWEGYQKGIFERWDDCKKAIDKYPNARYKSYDTRAEADTAYQQPAPTWGNPAPNGVKKPLTASPRLLPHAAIVRESIAVDAACSGNPGAMEYKGVNTVTKEVLFHVGPLDGGTNNVGEFLALVHALAMLKAQGKPTLPIYSDSRIAIGWIAKRHAKTELKPTKRNTRIFELLERAEAWLANNAVTNPILKWETKVWGEIPADFGRK